MWIQRYKPFLPTNLLKFRLVNVLGIGGLYTLMTSTEGSYTICRSSFVQYCMSSNDVEVNLFMQFVDSCFRLRMTDDSEVRAIF